MKVLWLVLLALLLGAGLLYLALDPGEPGRGSRAGPADERTPAGGPAPATREAAAPAPAEAQSPAAPVEEPGRRSVAPAPAPETRLSYEGVVLSDGGPVPGVALQLLRREELLGEAQSDERGRFRIAIAPTREGLLLRVLARGFVPVERSLAAKPAGGAEFLGNLRVIRGQPRAGRVVDVRGAGVADAELCVEPMNAGSDVLRARGRSGPDGHFEIADGPPGTVLVTARAKGFGDRSVQHALGTPLEIQLAAGLELHLCLRSPRGAPVVGASVVIQTPSEARATPRTEESDDEGRVLFEGLTERTWSVRVTHPDFRPMGKSQVQVAEGEETLECVPWPAIEGVVQTPDGKPPPAGTRVQALPSAAPGDRIAQLTGGREVDADGHFRLGGLRPGDWSIRVLAPGFAPTSSGPVKLGIEGDGYAGTIVLTAGGKLTVQLTSQGKPAVGAEIEILHGAPTPAQLWAMQGARESRAAERARTGPDGRATIQDLAAGPVWVAIFAEGSPPQSSGPHEVGRGDPALVTVDLPRGARIHGRVLSRDGKPLAEAQLRITEPTGRLGFPLTLASDDEGRYTSIWLPPGHYTVEAYAVSDPTQRSGRKDVEVGPGEQRELDLSL